MEILKDIVSIIGSLAGLFVTFGVIICVTIPNIRNKIKESILKDKKTEELEEKLNGIIKLLEKQQKEDEALRAEFELFREADLCLVRDRITHIYYKNLSKKSLKAYELENLSKLYALYVKLGGNSYIQNVYKIMTEEWEIKQ